MFAHCFLLVSRGRIVWERSESILSTLDWAYIIFLAICSGVISDGIRLNWGWPIQSKQFVACVISLVYWFFLVLRLHNIFHNFFCRNKIECFISEFHLVLPTVTGMIRNPIKTNELSLRPIWKIYLSPELKNIICIRMW